MCVCVCTRQPAMQTNPVLLIGRMRRYSVIILYRYTGRRRCARVMCAETTCTAAATGVRLLSSRRYMYIYIIIIYILSCTQCVHSSTTTRVVVTYIYILLLYRGRRPVRSRDVPATRRRPLLHDIINIINNSVLRVDD